MKCQDTMMLQFAPVILGVMFCLPYNADSTDNTQHELDGLVWFIHLSDIHVSKFYDQGRISDLDTFCRKNIDVVKPEVVLVTGDLTDAKLEDRRGSKQFDEEWIAYFNILQQTGVLEKTIWFDIRGNHDAFNVPSLDDHSNLYKYYSGRSKSKLKSEHFILEKNNVKVSFIAVDTCPNPGPKRPFNFFGIFTEDAEHELKVYVEESKSSDFTVWFGHYPTSVVHNPEPLRGLLAQGDIYLCGHLHTLGGFVPAMYTKHSAGNLELEVGDWKDNRIYRILALDNGLLSFSDQRFDEWPVILITNPKHANYLMLEKEPIHKMLESTHIRILIFNDTSIEKVKVLIDGAFIGEASHISGPLYTVPWKAKDFESGMHTMVVTVKDSLGKTTRREQPFSLDGTQIPFDLVRQYLLMSDIPYIGKILFIALWTGLTGALISLKILSHRYKVTRPNSSFFIKRFLWRWIYKIQILTLRNKVFYGFLLFHTYIAIGPWFIGEVISGHIGICTIWGIYVNGHFLPGTLTYIYGAIQILFFSIPLLLYLGHCLSLSLQYHQYSTSKSMYFLHNLKNHGFFVIFIFIHGFFGVREFFSAYGMMATIFGPVRTGNVLVAFILRYLALNTQPSSIAHNIKTQKNDHLTS